MNTFTFGQMLLNADGFSLESERLVYAFFAFVIFILLFYFWFTSQEKAVANQKRSDGLVYLAFAYFLYGALGVLSAKYPLTSGDIIPGFYLIFSGLISVCFLSSLTFFQVGNGALDQFFASSFWKNGLKYFGFAWVIIISIEASSRADFAWAHKVLVTADLVISIIALSMFGYMIVRYFMRRQLRFPALVTAITFLVVFVLLVYPPAPWSAGRFVHVSTLVLGPALAFSVMILVYTFTWINELNFYEISNIWIEDASSEDTSSPKAYAQLAAGANRSTWTEKIANDKLETVIEEVIIFKKHKNENLEVIINIASRNTRNNNNHLQQLIKYQDYQLNRNQLSHALVQFLIKEGLS